MVPRIFDAEVCDLMGIEKIVPSIEGEQVIKTHFIISSQEEALPKMEKYKELRITEVEFLGTSPD